MVIDHGRVIADDTPARLKAELAGDLLSLDFADRAGSRAAAAMIQRLDTARDVVVDGANLHARVTGGSALLPGLLRALDADGLVVTAAQVTRPTLDDVFLNLTGRSLREGQAAATGGSSPADRPAGDLDGHDQSRTELQGVHA